MTYTKLIKAKLQNAQSWFIHKYQSLNRTLIGYLLSFNFNKYFRRVGSFLTLTLTIVSLAQFAFIKVDAASPGPFWTWNGTGIPTKIADSENFDIINVGGVYFDSNSTFYTALAGNNTYTWGANNRNQLGTTSTTSVPTIVPALSGLKKVASG